MGKNDLVNSRRETTIIISKKVGAKIKERRKSYGWTMDEFCCELVDYGLDISSEILGKYERGERIIPLDRLYIFMKALQVEGIYEIFPKEIPWNY